MVWDGEYDFIHEDHAFFAHMRKPGQCSGEMLVAELQRVFCCKDLDDAFIQNTGSKLTNAVSRATDADSLWLSHYFDVISRYPVDDRKASKHRTAYVIPLIPSVATFSSPRRVTKRAADDGRAQDRSWKPGLLIKECLSYSVQREELENLFREIQEALRVGDGDDLFAKFLDEKVTEALKTHLGLDIAEKYRDNSFSDEKICYMPQDARDKIANAPFKRFASDIKAVLQVKPYVSRRQFIAMIESVVRIGTTAHVLWLCNITRRLEDLVIGVCKSADGVLTEADVYEAMNMPQAGIFNYGSNFGVKLREFYKQHERSSKRLNYLMYLVKEVGCLPASVFDWKTPESFINSINAIAAYCHGDPQFMADFERGFSEYYMSAIKRFSLQSDSQSTHMKSFVQTTLIQNIQPKEPRYARYDQSYLVRHRTHDRRSAMIVNAGAVTLMTLVHCCSHQGGAVLLSSLADALQCYGIGLPKGDTLDEFKEQLRDLGLTIDSPDAEFGMVLQDIVAGEEGGL